MEFERDGEDEDSDGPSRKEVPSTVSVSVPPAQPLPPSESDAQVQPPTTNHLPPPSSNPTPVRSLDTIVSML